MNLKDLTKEIQYQWRVQSFSKQKPSCSCVAYIDARDAMNLLDEVVGSCNWQDDYRVIHGQLFAGIGIKCGEEWVWKWDTGTESQTEKEKGIVSDSFKRAGVKWGIGRFLYDLPIKYLKANEVKKDGNYPYPVDDNGNRIWDVTEFINKGMKSDPKPETETPSYKSALKAVQEATDFKMMSDKINDSEKLTSLEKEKLIKILNERKKK